MPDGDCLSSAGCNNTMLYSNKVLPASLREARYRCGLVGCLGCGPLCERAGASAALLPLQGEPPLGAPEITAEHNRLLHTLRSRSRCRSLSVSLPQRLHPVFFFVITFSSAGAHAAARCRSLSSGRRKKKKALVKRKLVCA